MSEAKFSPLLSLARHAQRRRMEMQCDPQWVLDVFAERDTLRAEVERLQQALAEQPDSVKVSRELLRRALQDCMFLPLEETVRRNADRNAALRELRALLA